MQGVVYWLFGITLGNGVMRWLFSNEVVGRELVCLRVTAATVLYHEAFPPLTL